MIPKNRIHLSRSLTAQTTPYPGAKRFLKRAALFFIFLLGVGIYLAAKPTGPRPRYPDETKQILGEQNEPEEPQYLIYKVKKGDTLFNLSQRYSVSWQTLAELNGLAEPYVLKAGQDLKIPAPLTP